jgi:hypothetical protein
MTVTGKFLKHPASSLCSQRKIKQSDYAQNRACFRSGQIRVLDSKGTVERNDCVQRCGSKAVMRVFRVGEL